ncbi:odorant receptor 13a-like [Nylanderia fulva]|uniref:odorant receptor 13a-like n=1 Tax=Nylanderia fulva TaxID=613905 RepID=UPI0010FB3D1C|nr:odorant receptor 13a-like [Nylanderia fulva]
MTATVSLSLEVIRHCHGFEDAFDAFLSASSSVISISKLLLHRVNWRDKLILVQAIIHDWTSVKNPHTRDIMLKYARTVLQMLQVLVNCISQCGNDGFFFQLTMHVCGQFEVLRMNFTDIISKQSLSHNKLGILLKRHHRLIDLAHHLQEAYSLVILSQLLMSVLLLCIEGFQLILTLSIHNTFAAMKHILFIMVLLVQLFIYCFAGQTLESQSQELAYAIYETPWYNVDINVMKDLPLMILRAANPHRLTAGKLLAINFESFKEILKASASYLSVLRVMLDT